MLCSTIGFASLGSGVLLASPLAGRQLVDQWRTPLIVLGAVPRSAPRMVGVRAGTRSALANQGFKTRLVGPLDGTVIRQNPQSGTPNAPLNDLLGPGGTALLEALSAPEDDLRTDGERVLVWTGDGARLELCFPDGRRHTSMPLLDIWEAGQPRRSEVDPAEAPEAS